MHCSAYIRNEVVRFEWKLGVSSSVSPPSEAFQNLESNDQILVPADEDRTVFPH